MIPAFKNKQPIPARSLGFPRMTYINERLESNFNKFLTFYRFNDFAVRSDHILVTLINSLLIPPTTQREHAYDLITQAAYSVGAGLGIGSPLYKAKVQKRSQFYGAFVKELIYLTPKNPFKVNYPDDWRHAEAVKVITHPKSDITFRLLDGKEISAEDGYALIEIDAGLLHWQYRKFVAYEQAMFAANSKPRLGVAHFVAKFVLPNLLKSHLKVAWVNRIIRYNNGQPTGENQRREPFALPSSLTSVDETIHLIFEKLSQSDLTILQMLDNIPLPFNDKLLAFIHEPNEYPDSRNIKAWRIARSQAYIALGLSLRFQASGSADPIMPSLARLFNSIKSEKIFSAIVGDEQVALQFQETIVPYITA